MQNDIFVSLVEKMVLLPVMVYIEPGRPPENVDTVQLMVHLEHAKEPTCRVIRDAKPGVRIPVDLYERVVINGKPFAI